ncbi:hypothetical protein [Spectribacter hydrogenoxidans]|uniref:Uncharacterized protein n=1 Tax=Spectribacter hydrogenoxidans TaxID=3075608 RepID=A0ABU3C2X7_9GAMM|nr:hypothetical protein [Salinisphaera sp. W335]MDT0635910.1 hypothetical protein [Salinisphaera sp. W335]
MHSHADFFDGTEHAPQPAEEKVRRGNSVSADVSADARTGKNSQGGGHAASADVIEHELDGWLHRTPDDASERFNGVIRTKKQNRSGGAKRTARCDQKKIESGLKRISLWVPEDDEEEVKTLANTLTERHRAKQSRSTS